jgi:hypothetical protein
MQSYELRVYKLRTKEAFDFHREVIYPRHLNSHGLVLNQRSRRNA